MRTWGLRVGGRGRGEGERRGYAGDEVRMGPTTENYGNGQRSFNKFSSRYPRKRM